MKVTSLDTNEEGDHTATGIRVDTLEGDININVASDLLVEGGVNDTGIVLNRHAHEEFAASDAEKVNPEELNGFSLGDQIIDGKVVQVYKAEQEDGTALYYDEEGNVYDCVTVANEGTTQIVIGRDVISDGNGVELSAAGEEKTDLIIDGSLFATGGTSVVIKNDDMVLGDNLTLTTWEMTADQDGDYVKREKYDKILNNKIFVADHEAEKAIQYIIRVDERQKNIIHIDGTTRYKDRDVAKEGDKIVVKVDVPEGSAIDEIYCDNNKTKLSQDNNGEYFMIVPRGGGVLLSANFRESKEATVKEEPKPISVTYNGSAQELVTAGTAEGGTIQYALGTDATTAPTTGFTTSIPTGTNADNYFVRFKAVADNKYDTDGETLCLPVSISTNMVFPAPFLPMMAICSPSSEQKFTGSAIDHSGFRALALMSSIVFIFRLTFRYFALIFIYEIFPAAILYLALRATHLQEMTIGCCQGIGRIHKLTHLVLRNLQ